MAQRQVAALAGMDLPDVGAAQEQFRLFLESEPEAADPEMEDLMIVFGLQ